MILAADWYAPTVAAIGVIVAAAAPAWFTHRRLGKPNGGGTVVGEIAQVKEAAKAAQTAAESAANSAATAAAAAITASSSAQLAAAMSEANGTKIEQLSERVKIVEHEIGLVPRKPF